MLEKRKAVGLYTQLGLLTASRTVINTGFRMVSSLLPVFARELRVEISSIALILSLSQLIGLAAPITGNLAARYGRRFNILLGMMLFNLGMLAVVILPNFWGFAIAILSVTIAKVTLDPSLQAYFGERVPYEKRGMVMGIIELAWSGAVFLGVPFVTWLLATFNWQAPFLALSFLGMIGFAIASFILGDSRKEAGEGLSLLKAIRASISSKAAAAGIGFIFCITAANQFINITFATWIEDSFGIMLSSLAIASFAIGIAELTGESLVVFIADRFGKRRLMFLGIGGNLLVCLFLPFLGLSLEWAIFGLFCFYLSFELGLVASLPLFSELSPSSRAMYMTVIAAASTLSRAIFSGLAPFAYSNGIFVNCVFAFVFNAIALALLWRFIDLD